ncbi:MAG: hypothetical protein QM804_18515 [Propionicimonas sp.]
MVDLEFDDVGAADFLTVTTHLSTQTEPMDQFAIVLDDKVISAPSVSNADPGRPGGDFGFVHPEVRAGSGQRADLRCAAALLRDLQRRQRLGEARR